MYTTKACIQKAIETGKRITIRAAGNCVKVDPQHSCDKVDMLEFNPNAFLYDGSINGDMVFGLIELQEKVNERLNPVCIWPSEDLVEEEYMDTTVVK